MGLFSAQISTKTMVPLCRHLATAYGAGIPITRSLELICANTNDKRVREVFSDIRHRIREGATLEDAARTHAKYLPAMFVELLASGEMGGKLDAAFLDLASYYEDRLAMRRTIVGKAAYPMLQLATAWFLGTFALGIVRNISFVSRGFSLGGYFESYLAFQMKALVMLAVLVAGCAVLSRLGIFQWIWGWVATYLWPLSAVTLRFAQARFFRSLALLISSGVPIVKAIERSASVTANPYVREDLLKAIPRVKRGDTLVEAFSSCRFLSSVAREMLSVGEETGRLEDTLHKVSQYQMNEAVHAVNIATRVGEVVIALVMAAVVGYIIISFYSNYYGRMMDELRI